MTTIKSSTTATTAYSVDADTTGALVIQTGAAPTTALTISSAQVVTLAQVLPEASGGTGTTTGYYGFKNRIINGAMVIDQRNAGASFTSNGLLYCVDRWILQAVGATNTAQQITGSTGNNKAVLITGSSGNTLTGFSQRIEAANIYDCASQSVTVSFTLVGSASGSVSVRFLYPTATDNYTSTTEPVAGTTVSFTTVATQYSVTRTLDSNANKGVWVYFDFGAVGASVTRTIEFVQLEKGSTATSFDYRPYGTELALCQRYFEKSVSIDTAILTNTAATFYGNMQSSIANGIWYLTIPFKVTKRAAPTVTTYPYTTASNTGRFSNNVGTDYGASSAAAGGIYDSQFNVQNNSGGTLSIGSGIVFGSWFASAEL